MHRLAASTAVLALCLAASPAAGAQSRTYAPDQAYDRYDGPGYDAEPYDDYDYARVLDVRPVIEERAWPASGERCYERREDYAGDAYGRSDGYDDGYYAPGDGYRDDNGRDDYGRDDGRYGRDPYRRPQGTEAGRTMATVLGGVVGAVLGSQVGGGSARYATSAIGTMVGGIAGQKVYENGVRERHARAGTVTVCEPVAGRYGDDRAGGGGVSGYDVTYEYAGRRYTTRTPYHPGDRIRVRVDVQPYD